MTSPERPRYMRLIVFFDLPVETAKQRKDYREFRKFLLKDGYLQLQQSVYVRLVINDGEAKHATARLRKKRPPTGLVQVLKIHEAQYAGMEYIVGEKPNFEEVETTDELLVL